MLNTSVSQIPPPGEIMTKFGTTVQRSMVSTLWQVNGSSVKQMLRNWLVMKPCVQFAKVSEVCR